MAYIRKRGASWAAEVRLKGVEKVATFPTKGEASAWAVETERNIRAGKSVFTTKILEDAILRYAETVSPHKKSNLWEQNRALWLCKQPIARIKLDVLSSTDLAEWRDSRLKDGVSGATIKRDFNYLSAILTTALKEWRWIAVNPASDVQRPKDSPGRVRKVSDDELKQLYFVAGNDPSLIQCRAIMCFEFCIETAMRSSEARSITQEAIKGKTAFLRNTKNGDSRTVPLSPRAFQLLKIVGWNFALSASGLDANFRKIRDKAGIANLHFHDSRHEAICRLSKVFGVLDLARITGHRNLNELMTYYHADAHELAVKLSQFDSRPIG